MEQTELFRMDADKREPQVPGFWMIPDYITPEEEEQLLSHLENGPWETDWRRRIQQYGLGYGSEGGAPRWIRDFPDWLRRLAERVSRDAHFGRNPENCVINEYIPPLGIAPHKDYPAFGSSIACVSLASGVVTDFTRPRPPEKVSIWVPPRSLWVITGEARSVWRHGIAPRLTDVVDGERRKRSRRVSITFRTAARE